jgi:hypothetical protein
MEALRRSNGASPEVVRRSATPNRPAYPTTARATSCSWWRWGRPERDRSQASTASTWMACMGTAWVNSHAPAHLSNLHRCVAISSSMLSGSRRPAARKALSASQVTVRPWGMGSPSGGRRTGRAGPGTDGRELAGHSRAAGPANDAPAEWSNCQHREALARRAWSRRSICRRRIGQPPCRSAVCWVRPGPAPGRGPGRARPARSSCRTVCAGRRLGWRGVMVGCLLTRR